MKIDLLESGVERPYGVVPTLNNNADSIILHESQLRE